MYYIMSSGTKGAHSKPDLETGGPVKKMLDLMWIKINERFKSIAEAYRYFDVNFNNRVSFNEFQKGLDFMRIKY